MAHGGPSGKRSASIEHPRRCRRIAPSTQRLRSKLARSLDFGGIRRNASTQSRRLITRGRRFSSSCGPLVAHVPEGCFSRVLHGAGGEVGRARLGRMSENEPDDRHHGDHDEAPGNGSPYLTVRRAAAVTQVDPQDRKHRAVLARPTPRGLRGSFGLCSLRRFALEPLLSQALDRIEHAPEGSGKRGIRSRAVSRVQVVRCAALTPHIGANQPQRLSLIAFLLPRSPGRGRARR
jgi:hypothetical protein